MLNLVIPTLRVKDSFASEKLFSRMGFERIWEHRDDPDSPRFIEMKRDRVGVFLSEHQGDGPFGIYLYFLVDDARELYDEWVANGVTIEDPPYETSWGHIKFEVVDPDGNTLSFGSKRG